MLPNYFVIFLNTVQYIITLYSNVQRFIFNINRENKAIHLKNVYLLVKRLYEEKKN